MDFADNCNPKTTTMSNLEQVLKVAAERLDAAIKRELELIKQSKPQGNPEDDKFKAETKLPKQ